MIVISIIIIISLRNTDDKTQNRFAAMGNMYRKFREVWTFFEIRERTETYTQYRRAEGCSNDVWHVHKVAQSADGHVLYYKR